MPMIMRLGLLVALGALAVQGCSKDSSVADHPDGGQPDGAPIGGDGGDPLGASDPGDIGPAVLINYPKTGAASQASGGFYITSFPGTTLATVRLWLAITSEIGGAMQSIDLIARADTFNGTGLGVAHGGVAFPSTFPTEYAVDFDFGDVSVAQGSTVAFYLRDSIDDPVAQLVFDDVGDYGGRSGSAIGVVRTAGVTAPLDTKVGDGIATVVSGSR